MHQTNERVVVTGGAGFIGSHLVDRLLVDTRAEVVVLDNLQHGQRANLAAHAANPRLRIIAGDIRDEAVVTEALCGATTVFHLAACRNAEATGAAIDETFAANVVGTVGVLRAAVKQGVGRIVFASSHEAYGEPISLPVDEGHPLLPITAYGASKAAGEMYCRLYRRIHGLETVIIRFAQVYGPRQHGHVLAEWTERALAGHDLDLFGGTRVMDVLWIDQAVEALLRASVLPTPLPSINVGSGTGVRLLHIARQISRLAGGRSRVRVLPARSAEVTRFVANVDRMRQVLQLDPPLDPLSHLPTLLKPAVGVGG